MNTLKTTLTTEAVYSEDETKRYLLKKEWDATKPKLAIIMLAPSVSSGIEIDTTTQLVLNNAVRLGYGSVDILNLFTTLNDFSLKYAEDEDTENIKIIVKSARSADTIVYAAGVGKAKNKTFLERQSTVLNELRAFENKLHCLCNKNGNARFQHPLSPAVREWNLSSFRLEELTAKAEMGKTKQEKKEKK